MTTAIIRATTSRIRSPFPWKWYELILVPESPACFLLA